MSRYKYECAVAWLMSYLLIYPNSKYSTLLNSPAHEPYQNQKNIYLIWTKTFIQFKKIITIYWFRNVIFTYHWISRQKKIETMKKSPPLLSLAQISQYKCNIRFERTWSVAKSSKNEMMRLGNEWFHKNANARRFEVLIYISIH